MANLRDKGYPSAKEYRPNRSDKRNALMTGDTSGAFYAGTQPISSGFKENDALKKLVTAYNGKAFGVPNAPMLSYGSFDFVDDNTDSRGYDSALAIRAHDGNRLGFLGKNFVDGGNTYYNVGVDNLPFGENTYNRAVNTPFGNLEFEYDGDGTASLSLEGKPNYYIQALANLLRGR